MTKYPLIIFVICFICGIVVNNFWEIDLTFLFIVWGTLLLSTLPLYFLLANPNIKEIIRCSFPIHFVMIGYLYSSFFSVNTVQYPFEKQKIRKAIVYGKIEYIELQRKNRIVFETKIDSINFEDGNYRIQTKILCNIIEEDYKKLSAIYKPLGIGNYIALKGTFQKGSRDRKS